MTDGKRIVILGGGVGGIVAANELRRLLPGRHRITLIERSTQHEFAPSFLWVMSGTRTVQQIRRPLQSLLRKEIEIFNSTATRIDTTKSVVETESGDVQYDYLIIAVGAELAMGAILGLGEAAHSFYSLNDASRLYGALRRFTGNSVAMVVASMPYKCPGAPLEGAMLIADFLSRQAQSGKTKVSLYTPEPQPMPVAGPDLGKAAVDMLSARGIEYFPGSRLQSVDPASRRIAFDGKGEVDYDLLVAIPPHRCPQVVAQSGLTRETGWIPVDRGTLRTNVENIYAIGDVTSIPLPGRWNPEAPMSLPKAGVFAHTQGLVAAHRIVGEITGESTAEVFCGDGYCMLEAGEDLAGFAYGNFFAEPSPQVKLKRIGKAWHIGKVLFEKWWLAPYGMRRGFYRQCLRLGSKLMGIPSDL